MARFCLLASVSLAAAIAAQAQVGPRDCAAGQSVCGYNDVDFAGADVNGTCATSINITPVYSCSGSAAGRVGGRGDQVDLDVYRYTVGFAQLGETRFHVFARAESPVVLTFEKALSSANPCGGVQTPPYRVITVPACQAVETDVDGLTPGEVVFVTVRAVGPTPCSEGTYFFYLEIPTSFCDLLAPNCFRRDAPPENGHYVMGGQDCFPDHIQCMADWDRNGVLNPADVAAFVQSAYYGFVNPGNLDADINCSGGMVVPAHVGAFLGMWFSEVNHPANCGG